MTMQPDTNAPNGAQPPPPAPAQSSAMVVAPPPDEGSSQIVNPYANRNAFESAQRIAKAVAASDIVPEAFRGKIANVLLAMSYAHHLRVDLAQIMQEAYIVHGKISFSSKFLIGRVNASRVFSRLLFEPSGKEGIDSQGVRAFAKELESGFPCKGPLVTIGMAKAEGWYARSGSKWKTMPELMLHYRAGTFFARIFAPEMVLGMGQTHEEIIDTHGVSIPDAPAALTPGSSKALEATLLAEDGPSYDPTTGEVSAEEEARMGGDR